MERWLPIVSVPGFAGDSKVTGGRLGWLGSQPDSGLNEATIWIHRFFDISASKWGGGKSHGSGATKQPCPGRDDRIALNRSARKEPS
ncbi:MAG: hypothetical protein ACJ73J_05775 [Actinomycetes bacterium]